MKLWFETHSTSIDNERGVASGHLDTGLSDAGRLQAAELGVRCGERGLRTVYTSDLLRAVMTGEIAFAESAVRRVADPRLRECDYGSWSGCPAAQMEAGRERFIEEPFPGGESYRDVVRRVEAFLADRRQEEGPILVIGHRAPWYALEHLLKGRDLREVVRAEWKWQPGWEYEL